MTEPEPLRVVVADDHPMVRDGLGSLFDSVDDIRVVGEASTGPEAVVVARRTNPDLVVLDLALPDAGKADVNVGIKATREIVQNNAHVKVLIITASENGIANVTDVIAAGARGFLTKNASSECLLAAMSGVARGELWIILPPDYADALQPKRRPNLTQREYEVLKLVVDGLSNGQIARSLGIGDHAVANLVSQLKAKPEFDACDRTDLIQKAGELGWPWAR